MLTQEKGDLLTEFLVADEERALKVLQMKPEEAVKQINAFGNDFTVDELVEYGNGLKAADAFQKGELSLEDLDSVAGGGWSWSRALNGAFSGMIGGAALGTALTPLGVVGGGILGGIGGALFGGWAE